MVNHCMNLLLSLSVLSSASTTAGAVGNHNHIFNAIHSSMRQWGSSLNHNGMSFFLAHMPKGIHLYHGRGTPQPVRGLEWLAFEAEHAMFYAAFLPRMNQSRVEHHGDSRSQQVLGGESMVPQEDDDNPGWVHTYVTTNDLRLLYVDGMSAAKTHNGTQDSQDRILYNDTLLTVAAGIDTGLVGLEWERARHFCWMAQDHWGGRIDGVIRMQAGFEMFLCSFEHHLSLVRVLRAKPGEFEGGGPAVEKYNRAMVARYHGVGGGRVVLNYDHFVTAYSFVDLDLFPRKQKPPRLTQIPREKLEPVRRSLDEMILLHADADASSVPWQAIADMVVDRYTRPLQLMASGTLTLKELQKQADDLLSPFIDYYARDRRAELDRCTGEFTDDRAPLQGVAAQAVRSVVHAICSTVVDAREARELDTAVQRVQALVEYLQWTAWKECGTCGLREVCVIPVWPSGTVDEYEHPSCKNETFSIGGPDGYWGKNPFHNETTGHVYTPIDVL